MIFNVVSKTTGGRGFMFDDWIDYFGVVWRDGERDGELWCEGCLEYGMVLNKATLVYVGDVHLTPGAC